MGVGVLVLCVCVIILNKYLLVATLCVQLDTKAIDTKLGTLYKPL